MKPGPNPRRTRSRNGKRFQNSRNQTFESNGPDVKIRGTAQQVLEKYLSLAQDASSSGDRVNAEAYLQHAEHYYRLIHIEGEANAFVNRNRDERPMRTPESIGMDESGVPATDLELEEKDTAGEHAGEDSGEVAEPDAVPQPASC